MLLASLLLGYGLDAWVCFGADAVGQQTWVLTRPSKDVALFWDPLSGGFFHMSTRAHTPSVNSLISKVKIRLRHESRFSKVSSDQVRQLSTPIAQRCKN